MTEGFKNQPSELVMAKLEAVEMPTLHGFEELTIGQDDGPIQLRKIGSTLIPVVLLRSSSPRVLGCSAA